MIFFRRRNARNVVSRVVGHMRQQSLRMRRRLTSALQEAMRPFDAWLTFSADRKFRWQSLSFQPLPSSTSHCALDARIASTPALLTPLSEHIS
jgi:hypothetical protein